MTIASNLKKFREEKGFSQIEMAFFLSISQSSYSRLESGKTAIRADLLPEICRILQVGIEDLFGIQSNQSEK